MNFDWTNFYMEFADKLLYKNNRERLIEKIMSIGFGIPKPIMEYNIDPFSVFGLFNKGYTEQNRITIIKSIKNEFKIESEIPKGFSGIPVSNPTNAYFFNPKGDVKEIENEINNLWELFEVAINYANNKIDKNL